MENHPQRTSPHRKTATFALCTLAVISILSALASLTLLVIVPLFSLQNDLWHRADNPHTIANVIFYLVISVTAVFAARSSDRVRFWLGVAAFLVTVACGLYELGVFRD